MCQKQDQSDNNGDHTACPSQYQRCIGRLRALEPPPVAEVPGSPRCSQMESADGQQQEDHRTGNAGPLRFRLEMDEVHQGVAVGIADRIEVVAPAAVAGVPVPLPEIGGSFGICDGDFRYASVAGDCVGVYIRSRSNRSIFLVHGVAVFLEYLSVFTVPAAAGCQKKYQRQHTQQDPSFHPTPPFRLEGSFQQPITGFGDGKENRREPWLPAASKMRRFTGCWPRPPPCGWLRRRRRAER